MYTLTSLAAQANRDSAVTLLSTFGRSGRRPTKNAYSGGSHDTIRELSTGPIKAHHEHSKSTRSSRRVGHTYIEICQNSPFSPLYLCSLTLVQGLDIIWPPLRSITPLPSPPAPPPNISRRWHAWLSTAEPSNVRRGGGEKRSERKKTILVRGLTTG